MDEPTPIRKQMRVSAFTLAAVSMLKLSGAHAEEWGPRTLDLDETGWRAVAAYASTFGPNELSAPTATERQAVTIEVCRHALAAAA